MKVTFLPIIEIEGATQHQNYIRRSVELMDFNKPSLIEFCSVYQKLLSFKNRYLHRYPITTVVEDSSACRCVSHFVANYLITFPCSLLTLFLRFTEVEMLNNIFIQRNLKMDEHLSYLYICFNTYIIAVPGPARKNADMIYQYGQANASSRCAAAYYWDANPNRQNYLTYSTI